MTFERIDRSGSSGSAEVVRDATPATFAIGWSCDPQDDPTQLSTMTD